VSKRLIISSVVAVVIGVAVLSVLTLERTPVLGSPLARPRGQSADRVQRLEADREPTRDQCGSTAFIDYAEDARGQATPFAAVLSYRPGAQNLRVQILESNRAIVDEFNGALKIAAYELFRMETTGWLVGRADTFAQCDSP
jgi:hypothetical protein